MQTRMSYNAFHNAQLARVSLAIQDDFCIMNTTPPLHRLTPIVRRMVTIVQFLCGRSDTDAELRVLAVRPSVRLFLTYWRLGLTLILCKRF